MKVRTYLRARGADGDRQYVDPVYAAPGRPKPWYAVSNGMATPGITSNESHG